MIEYDAATFVDSHCHIPQLIDSGGGTLEAILDRAKAAGVARMLSAGIDLESFPRLLEIAEQHEEVYVSAGIHPNHLAAICDGVADALKSCAVHRRVIGVGETGLDYFHHEVAPAMQRDRFREHIRVARTIGKPLIVHLRDAGDDLFRILAEEHAEEVGGVMHCFTGGAQEASRALDLGFYLSFSGIITFKTAAALRRIAETVPLSRILIETDSPWLSPEPQRGKRNEPALVRHVAEAVAACQGISLAEVAAATTANFDRLFRLH